MGVTPVERKVERQIDFYRLPRPVQDRFAAATRNAAHPAPMLSRPASRATAWIFVATGAALFAVECVLLASGWGDVTRGLAIHGGAVRMLDVALVAAALYCELHAAAVLVRLEQQPWRPGLYLFPGCIVDARTATFHVWPMQDVERVDREAAPAALVFTMNDGERVTVPARSAQDAARADDALAPLRGELARAISADDAHVMAELDPLHDRALSSPIGPTESLKPHVPVWVRVDWALALAIGLLAGEAVVSVRNLASDNAMYRAVTAAGTVPAYEAYVAREGRHASEVQAVALPRLQLREAEAGGLEAVRAFARAHPDSAIQPEIDAALRRLMLAELEKAKAAGTVGALDDFARKYPEPVVEPERRAARHALFANALAAWRTKTHPDGSVDALMTRLVGEAERTGATAEVRFRQRPSNSLADADRSALKSRHFPGPDALPSKYVTPETLRPHEQAVEEALARRFAGFFPPDVLTVRPGEPLAADAPAPTTPTLLVDYAPEWSRGETTSAKPLTVFMGLSFTFDAAFVVPGGPPWSTTAKSWRVAEPWKVKSQGVPLDEFMGKVYDAMIGGAFDQLQNKLTAALF